MTVSNLMGNDMDVSFYEIDGTQIGITQTNIPNGLTTAVNWLHMAYNSTNQWYAEINDGITTYTTGVYNLGFSCYSIWDKGTDEYSLYGGSNTIGRVYHVFDGLNDDGADITWYDDVQGVDLGMPDRYKAWYNIYIKVKTTSEATSTLKMYYTLDANTEHYVSKHY